MDPLTQSLIGSRTLPPAGSFDHWQASPLRIALSLASGVNVSGALSIVAEIHASQTIAADPLASVEVTPTDTDGPWTFDFTGPQLNQTIPESRATRSLWLVIAVVYPDDRIEIIATRTITLHRSNYAGAVADPPAAVTYLTAAAAAALYYTKTEVDALIAEGGGGGGGANLTSTLTSTSVTIVSDSGTDATIPAADATNAGVLTAADKIKLNGLDTGSTGSILTENFQIRSTLADWTATFDADALNASRTLIIADADGTLATQEWAAGEYVSKTETRASNTFFAGPADASVQGGEFRRISPDDLSPDNYSTATATKVLHGNMTWSPVSLTADITGTLPVGNGGTGLSSATAYAVLCGGTTGTGALQSVSGVGSSGQVLTSNGAGALPTWQTASASGTKTIARFYARDNEPPATNFATLDTRNGHLVLDFDTTTQEKACFRGTIPQGTSLTNGLVVKVRWAATSATSGTVGWDAAFERITDGGQDIDSDGFGTAQTITAATVPGSSGVTKVTSVTFSQAQLPSGLAPGDDYRLCIRRDVANDTATGDAELVSVIIEIP